MALSWCFEDERTAVGDAALDAVAERGAVVPALWRLEMANGFRSAIRRGGTTAAYRDEVLDQLRGLTIVVDPETSEHAWRATLALADKHCLTPYDAAYLELAQR